MIRNNSLKLFLSRKSTDLGFYNVYRNYITSYSNLYLIFLMIVPSNILFFSPLFNTTSSYHAFNNIHSMHWILYIQRGLCRASQFVSDSFSHSVRFVKFNLIYSYWDFYCQEYAGSVDLAIGQVTGGPYGSRSALWVDADSENSFCTGASAGMITPDKL